MSHVLHMWSGWFIEGLRCIVPRRSVVPPDVPHVSCCGHPDEPPCSIRAGVAAQYTWGLVLQGTGGEGVP